MIWPKKKSTKVKHLPFRRRFEKDSGITLTAYESFILTALIVCFGFIVYGICEVISFG